ncbi:hypothetical protein QEM11_003896 [Pseudomonas putida]|nr:hypothetical protein [Pseudomonas putida]
MSQAKERPILFSGPMVRAILEGRKTVTRRIVKATKSHADGIIMLDHGKGWWPFNMFGDSEVDSDGMEYQIPCPHGKPGDRLWVRETWFCDHFEVMRGPYLKPADLNVTDAREDGTLVYAADGLTPYEADQPAWKPSIHMPRWASRILLEVTDVRVERLQDISDDQARSEGMLSWTFEECDGDPRLGGQPCTTTNWHWEPQENECDGYGCAEYAFAGLWKAINGESAWDANPWVWVVEFKVVEPDATGCDYHGSHFGAPYPDAQCVDGFLWDEDSCDVPGGPLLSGGDIPCPKCNAEAYADHQREVNQ